jgi:phage-related tail fiber protein
VAEGINRKGRFTGVLTLTHNATSLILPGNADITTANNDRYEARSLGGGNWIVTKYVYANGSVISATNANTTTPIKLQCRAATTANITLAGGAPNTLDGATLAADDRILVKNQSTASENGIYIASTLGTGANGTWTRATDADGAGDMFGGMLVAVSEGTENGNSLWMLTTNDPITIGTTALTFERKDAGAVAVPDVPMKTVRASRGANVANLAGGAPNTADGVSLAVNNRILVIGQSTASQNGIYVVTVVGTGSNGTWVRAADVISSGMLVTVSEGTTNADSLWMLTT